MRDRGFSTRLDARLSSSLAAPYHDGAPRPATADTLLYLDFDGVVQHEAVYWSPRGGAYMSPREAPGRSLFEWTEHLECVLKEFPTVRLVLSSSWCVKPGYSRALKRLTPALRERFIGGTFHRRVHGADPWILESFRATPRWKQIAADVARRRPRAWLALDDDVEDWPDELRDNLVACAGSTGLSSPEVREDLRRKLRLAVGGHGGSNV